MQSHQTAKIQYQILSDQVKSYLIQQGITEDEWELKLTPQDQSKMIDFALNPVRLSPLQPLPLENKDAPAIESFLTCRGTDHLILQYVGEDVGSSEKYSPFTTGQTLFEKALPVIALLKHVVRGEQKEADALLQKNPLLLLESGRVTDYTCTADLKHYRTVEAPHSVLH